MRPHRPNAGRPNRHGLTALRAATATVLLGIIVFGLLSHGVKTASGKPVTQRFAVVEYGSLRDRHGGVLARELDPRNTPSTLAVTDDGAVHASAPTVRSVSFATPKRSTRMGMTPPVRVVPLNVRRVSRSTPQTVSYRSFRSETTC